MRNSIFFFWTGIGFFIVGIICSIGGEERAIVYMDFAIAIQLLAFSCLFDQLEKK